MSADPGRVAFHDLPADSFPFTVRFFRGGDLVHEFTVRGSGAFDVPAVGPGVRVIVEYADGESVEVGP